MPGMPPIPPMPPMPIAGVETAIPWDGAGAKSDMMSFVEGLGLAGAAAAACGACAAGWVGVGPKREATSCAEGVAVVEAGAEWAPEAPNPEEMAGAETEADCGEKKRDSIEAAVAVGAGGAAAAGSAKPAKSAEGSEDPPGVEAVEVGVAAGEAQSMRFGVEGVTAEGTAAAVACVGATETETVGRTAGVGLVVWAAVGGGEGSAGAGAGSGTSGGFMMFSYASRSK